MCSQLVWILISSSKSADWGYKLQKCNLLSPDGAETEFFKITTGVLQGYTLAPYLLIIVLDYVVQEAIDGQEESLGLTIKQRQGHRV